MNSRGAILIITLWILAILTLFVLSLGFRMSIEAKLTDYNLKSFKLFYLIKAAVNSFKAELKRDVALDYDSLNEGWSNNEELFKDVEVGEGVFTISYVRKEDPSEKVFYGAMDEEAKININTAPREILLNLPDITEDIADSILAWRGENLSEEENDYYRLLEFPYVCKGGLFQSKEELLLVRGMRPEIFNNIKDIITIHGDDGKVNLNTADSRVMEALGLNKTLIDEIIKYRAGSDGEEGSPYDNVFENMTDIMNLLNSISALSVEEKSRMSALLNDLTDVASSHFRVHITAKTEDGKIIKKAEVVLSRSENGAKIENWYEY